MKDIRNAIAMIMFYVLALVLVLWTGSNTFELLGAVAGQGSAVQYFGLALFEGGMLAWLAFFLYKAEGKWQRTFAVMGSFVDLLLLVAAVGVHLFVRVAPLRYAEAAIWIVIVATLINIVLMWLAHIADPRNMETMRIQGEMDKTMELAHKMVEEKRAASAASIADAIAHRIVEDAHSGLQSRYTAQPQPVNGDGQPPITYMSAPPPNATRPTTK